jgi:hypothetical protein
MFICLLEFNKWHNVMKKNEWTFLLSENLPQSVEQSIHDVNMHMPQHQLLASSCDLYLPD